MDWICLSSIREVMDDSSSDNPQSQTSTTTHTPPSEVESRNSKECLSLSLSLLLPPPTSPSYSLCSKDDLAFNSGRKRQARFFQWWSRSNNGTGSCFSARFKRYFLSSKTTKLVLEKSFEVNRYGSSARARTIPQSSKPLSIIMIIPHCCRHR